MASFMMTSGSPSGVPEQPAIPASPMFSATYRQYNKRMQHQNIDALVLVTAFVLLPVAMAVTVQHTLDWDFAPYPSYYSDWATSKKFIAGESKIFVYDPTIHNVQQVSWRDFIACNTTHAIQEYGTGEDVITLKAAGTYYFICGFTGHCSQGGMLMKVPVGAGPPLPPDINLPLPPPSPSPPPPHHPPPPPHHPPPPPPHSPPPPRHPPPRHPPPPPPASPPLLPPSISPASSPAHSPSVSILPPLPTPAGSDLAFPPPLPLATPEIP